MPGKTKVKKEKPKREKKRRRKKGEPEIEELELAEVPATPAVPKPQMVSPHMDPAELIAMDPGRPPSPIFEAMNGTQKAAAVIVALGVDKASGLYQFMDAEDVEQLTLEVAKLGFLDSDTTEDVLTEFYQMCMTNKAVTEGGLEYARSVLEKAFGAQSASSLLDKVTKSLKNREFSFMNKAGEKDLFTALQHERPQTIALVLSYIEPDKAAGVVAQLDPNTQLKVVQRIAQMDSASPSAVKIIENEMSQRFANIFSASHVQVGGIDHVGLGFDIAEMIMPDSYIEVNGFRQRIRDIVPGYAGLPLLTDTLRQRGYTEEELSKIYSGNFLRVFREVL